MKKIHFIFIWLVVCCDSTDKYNYTGSTPLSEEIRSFLDIPGSDSIDFIRWKLFMENGKYRLHCNYGIGKANTNGFINGGHKKEITGTYSLENFIYRFHFGSKILEAAQINDGLLHFLNKDRSLMIGNPGWSFTLNDPLAGASEKVNIKPNAPSFRDSAEFTGRTPCEIPGLGVASCYKLKWAITFYDLPGKQQVYRIRGTAWREGNGRSGQWRIVKIDGKTIYELSGAPGEPSIYLLHLDPGILVFTNKQGQLLIGNEDFSYTLNRS